METNYSLLGSNSQIIALGKPEKKSTIEGDIIYEQKVKLTMSDGTERIVKITVNFEKENATALKVNKVIQEVMEEIKDNFADESLSLVMRGKYNVSIELSQTTFIEDVSNFFIGFFGLAKVEKPKIDATKMEKNLEFLQAEKGGLIDPKARISNAVGHNALVHFNEAMSQADELAESGELKQKEFRHLAIGDMGYLAKLDKKGRLELHVLSQKLGSGSYGEVWETVNLMKGTKKAIKMELEESDEATQMSKAATFPSGSPSSTAASTFPSDFDLVEMTLGGESVAKQMSGTEKVLSSTEKVHEYEIGKELKALNGGVQPTGILISPKQVVNMSDGRKGIWMKRYDRDYLPEDVVSKENVKANFKRCLPDMYQILNGLDFLAKHQICHGDLKPENIFVDHLKGFVHMADLGGVQNLKNAFDGIRKSLESETQIQHRVKLGTYTPAYAREEDAIEAERFANDLDSLIMRYNYDLEQGNPEDVKKLKVEIFEKLNEAHEFIDIQLQRDVFATGCILYEALTGQFPFNVENKGPKGKEYSVPVGKMLPFDGSGEIDSPIWNLITRMLSTDPKERPTAQEALNIFNSHMKASFPLEYLKMKLKY